MRQTSLSFSLKLAPKFWKAHTFEAFFLVYRIEAKEAKIIYIKNFVTGIRTENYIILAELKDITLFCFSRARKDEFKIESRIIAEVKKLGPSDLVLAGCMFLVSPSFKDWNVISI